ncbi:hypothetical protein Tco_1068685 [Tanacetum coccineum]|uniref:Reverse transcriptase domain-containing protein n=1 Tax=Tanacetum coccineum TaxID=301880 RepID=A0ABQ5HGD6_9ASTR
MAERTMEELLCAPKEGYGEAIVLPKINADHFEIKTNLLQLVQANSFHSYERENPHAHINSFKKITSTLRFRDVPNDIIKLMMFPYSLEGAAKVWMNTTSRKSVSKTDERIDKLADQLSKKVVTPAPVKAVEEICVTCSGPHAWYNCPNTDNNQASVFAATDSYNQVNPSNRVSNQMAPPGFAPVQNNGQNSADQIIQRFVVAMRKRKKKLMISSKLVMKDPPRAIIVPISPLKELMPVSFGRPYIEDAIYDQILWKRVKDKVIKDSFNNELNELRDQAYENSLIYKERTKKLHDSKIKNRIFNVGPFTITKVFPYGTIELSQPDGLNFKVNGHRVKHYFGGDIQPKVVQDLHTLSKDE